MRWEIVWSTQKTSLTCGSCKSISVNTWSSESFDLNPAGSTCISLTVINTEVKMLQQRAGQRQLQQRPGRAEPSIWSWAGTPKRKAVSVAIYLLPVPLSWLWPEHHLMHLQAVNVEVPNRRLNVSPWLKAWDYTSVRMCAAVKVGMLLGNRRMQVLAQGSKVKKVKVSLISMSHMDIIYKVKQRKTCL